MYFNILQTPVQKDPFEESVSQRPASRGSVEKVERPQRPDSRDSRHSRDSYRSDRSSHASGSDSKHSVSEQDAPGQKASTKKDKQSSFSWANASLPDKQQKSSKQHSPAEGYVFSSN